MEEHYGHPTTFLYIHTAASFCCFLPSFPWCALDGRRKQAQVLTVIPLGKWLIFSSEAFMKAVQMDSETAAVATTRCAAYDWKCPVLHIRRDGIPHRFDSLGFLTEDVQNTVFFNAHWWKWHSREPLTETSSLLHNLNHEDNFYKELLHLPK